MQLGIRPIRPSSDRAGPSWSRPLRLAVAAAVGLALASCGGDPETAGGAAEPAATGADARRLAGSCPDPVVVQTSWWPESTHGGLYQLLGGRPTVDKAKKTIRGPLVSRGVDTGVQLEIRAGGPARGQQPVAALMRTDPAITLGQQATEEQVLGWAEQMPTVGVLAPFYVDPVVFIWDKGRHPDFNAIQDIGQTPTRVFTFRSANTDYLLGSGILRPTQVDYSYDGSPALFMSKPESVVGGFSTNEPFIYRSMGRDVDYAYVADTGYPNYRNALTVRADAREELSPCLRKLVPILQRGMIDFMAEPAAVLRRIVSLNTEYGASFPYPLSQAEYGVRVMRDDGLVSNPKDGPFGSFDQSRNSRMIDILRPIYAGRRQVVPTELTASTIATNEFLDRSVRMGGS